MRRVLSILGIILGLLLALEIVYFNASLRRPFSFPNLSLGGRTVVDVGERVHDLSLQSVDGRDFRLQDHAGKVVLINLFASW